LIIEGGEMMGLKEVNIVYDYLGKIQPDLINKALYDSTCSADDYIFVGAAPNAWMVGLQVVYDDGGKKWFELNYDEYDFFSALIQARKIRDGLIIV
jgi:hypothetical protein